jgi:acyl-coenzyme A thioesterase PaaI-like protein
VLEGEWAGWRRPDTDPFELHAGPFYCRQTADGTRLSAFRAARRHLNLFDTLHGGCLMAFADFALFWIARDELQDGGAVTASFNSEFVDAAAEGDLIEATGEVLRSIGSLIFVRGLISTQQRPLLSFSAILKKTRPINR